MSNYSRGYALENKVVNGLRKKGWVAWRSASSKSPVDVVAVDGEGQVHFFQLKKTRSGYFDKRDDRGILIRENLQGSRGGRPGYAYSSTSGSGR